ncbi:biogenesis of lysosome-related organelles complex 1 subunit 3 isoform 1-T2 [Clarias gariepinus]|uniref:biogenesis of lysosome-related organelles complex 1 subunit 3 n=1 Tax=Clarias gariepinus TaxID=13013 RepID=UPI00234DFE26|nr:biogenesis of lysosome-related organelles complex 1 subunit 3 [Clarias gariepinus]XP_053362914.1 biogenesis of lysosome-related organelles complex 1 subunit 3 [Clarias gariepinus]
MADRKSLIVVEGEASESDSDQEVYMSSGLTVPGEASETDSEDEEEKPTVFQHHLTPLTVERHDNLPITQQSPTTPTHGSQANSLLQQKLQESNARLCADVSQSVRQVYHGATRDIKAATAQLSHSQGVIIAASHAVRVAVDDLRAVCDKIDIITSCRLLPDIAMATASVPAPH